MDSFEVEINDFLNKWPKIKFIDLIFSDINATPRGKRILAKDLAKVKKGIALPISTITLNSAGSVIEEAGLGEKLGEPDHMCFPIPGSLTPTVNPQVGQLLLNMMESDGKTPSSLVARNILQSLLEKLHGQNIFPVVALELEFYLVDKKRTESGLVLPALNPMKKQHEKDTAVYDIDSLDDYVDFLSALNSEAMKQNLNTSGALSESAPGQFEINFNHHGDILTACDQVLFAKRLIRQVAHQHNFDVTFMAKPLQGEAGNGLHLHISLLDDRENNLFSNPDGEASPLFYQTLASMIHNIPSSIGLLCPNANSYRRFAKGTYTPTEANWAENHRAVALRIPLSNSKNRRIEHRIAGADANPYILASVVLSNVLAAKNFSPEQCPNPLDPHSPSIPTRMSDALTDLEQGELGQFIAEEFLQMFVACKRSELEQFESVITPLEVEWMLHTA